MEITSINEVPLYSRLGQNIYRHDGLLALPRGVVIREKELQELAYHGIEYVLVYDKRTSAGNEEDISFTMNIIESAYLKTTMWESSTGEEVYDYLHEQIMKNKKVQRILNDLRIADSYSFAHCVNISLIVVNLLLKEKIEMKSLLKIAYIALLHDVGRLKMIEVFGKKGKLTKQEYEKIQMHPEESFKMLKKAGFLEEEIAFVSETHERFNGTGYPYQLKGNEIAQLSQLILIADVYNALSSFRPYRESAYNPHKVLKMLEDEAGDAFNKEIVALFKRNFEPYRKGMQVELNDGRYAVVNSIHYSNTLPIVDVISEETGRKLEMIDLSVNENIRIQKILSI